MKLNKSYIQCRSCYFINESPKIKSVVSIKKIKCPFCSRIGNNKIWPSIEVIELLKIADKLDIKINFKKNMSYVIIEATLELMLGTLISTIIIPEVMPEPVSYDIINEALIDGYQGRNRLLLLYKKMGYGSFSENVKNIGKKEFLKHWDTIASRRNDFVHGKYSETKSLQANETNVDVDKFISDSFYVFKELNNNFIKNHFKNDESGYLIL